MKIGSHGYDHRPWRNLSEEELHREIHVARAKLEELTQSPIEIAACPFGDYDSRILRRLKAEGLRMCIRATRGDLGPIIGFKPETRFETGTLKNRY